MLVLSRKKKESVAIDLSGQLVIDILTEAAKRNEKVVIFASVEDIRSGKVRLGFSGPKDIPIHREEIYLKNLKSEGVGQDVAASG